MSLVKETWASKTSITHFKQKTMKFIVSVDLMHLSFNLDPELCKAIWFFFKENKLLKSIFLWVWCTELLCKRAESSKLWWWWHWAEQLPPSLSHQYPTGTAPGPAVQGIAQRRRLWGSTLCVGAHIMCSPIEIWGVFPAHPFNLLYLGCCRLYGEAAESLG